MRPISIGLVLAVVTAVSGAQAEDRGRAFKLLQLDGYHVKWGEPRLGTGAHVTYALVAAPMRFQQARNCSDMAPFTGLAATSGISPEVLDREVRAAFRVWEEAANLEFRPADDPASADILIGAQSRPQGRAFANVAYGPDDSGDVRTIDQALICLNPEQSWKIGFDGETDIYDLRYTIAHEIGHAIGLDHPSPSGQVMSFRYDERFSGLQGGDVGGAVELYGRQPAAVAATVPVPGTPRKSSPTRFGEFAAPTK